ncbi:MAG: hypothetical protein LBT94_01510 [Prevotellaceae bacterium]|nr:hypothetical protein [Prevotellaceae bacterium]
MKPQEYIINELKTLLAKFPNVRVRYEYNQQAVVHTIEVVPRDVYRSEEEYILWESEMFDKFVERYPTENICFISDDALVGIEQVDFTLYGKNFAPNNAKAVEQEFFANHREAFSKQLCCRVI